MSLNTLLHLFYICLLVNLSPPGHYQLALTILLLPLGSQLDRYRKPPTWIIWTTNHPRGYVLRNVPRSRSSNACRSSSCVFITIGPYQATGSSIGFPETRRNRIPSSPAWIVISSPRSKSTSVRLSASRGGVVSAHLIPSVGTASGPEALQNFPSPAKTYANALRAVSTGRVFLWPGGIATSR